MINVAQNKYCTPDETTGLIPEDEALCWRIPHREPDDLTSEDNWADYSDEDTYWDKDRLENIETECILLIYFKLCGISLRGSQFSG